MKPTRALLLLSFIAIVYLTNRITTWPPCPQTISPATQLVKKLTKQTNDTSLDKKPNVTSPRPFRKARLHVILQFPVLINSSQSQDNVLTLRQKEYVDSLRRNLISPHVERVHILFEGANVPAYIKALKSPGDWKIVYYQLGRRMHYKDAFEYASQNLLRRNVIIMNADCNVDKGFEYLDEDILSERTMYALTRHESPDSVDSCGATDPCGPKANYIGSHDAFLFRLLAPVPSPILDSLDYRTNMAGIEQLLMLNFRRYGDFTIKNPCKILHIIHNHCSNLRNGTEQLINGQRLDVYKQVSVDLYGEEVLAPFSGL